jgi:hypothetical protein
VLCIGPNDSNGNVISFFKRRWMDGGVWVMFCPKKREGLVQHAHKEFNHFGIHRTYSLFQI